ncbi:MAG: hypothetical protein ACI9LO_001877 [Planctomycetota bacterium]|jgi:hypothetical protein
MKFFLSRWTITTLVLVPLLAGCSAVTVYDYADNKPILVVEQFFNGSLSAHGIVKDRSGRVIRYFNADIEASWNNGTGTLDENFVFDDGELQRRIWTLQPDGAGGYRGTANDVIGASKLRVSGNSLFLKYDLRIPYGDSTIDIAIDDRMYLISEKRLINESVMTKWGFEVGRLMLVIVKNE